MLEAPKQKIDSRNDSDAVYVRRVIAMTDNEDLLVTGGNLLERFQLEGAQFSIARGFLINGVRDLDKLAVRPVADSDEVNLGISHVSRENPIPIDDEAVIYGVFEGASAIAASITVEVGTESKVLDIVFSSGFEHLAPFDVKSAGMGEDIGFLTQVSMTPCEVLVPLSFKEPTILLIDVEFEMLSAR